MCGIIGSYNYHNTFLLKSLMIESRIRGLRSIGIFNGKEISILEYENSDSFLEKTNRYEFDKIFIGHTRYSTSGNDCQPLLRLGVALAFNGVLTMEDLPMGVGRTDNDGEFLIDNISKDKRLGEGFPTASYSVIYSKDDKLYFSRNGKRPLYYFQNGSSILVASTDSIFVRSGITQSIKCVAGTVYSFDGNLKIERTEEMEDLQNDNIYNWR